MILIIDPRTSETKEMAANIHEVYPGDDVVAVNTAEEAMEYIKNQTVEVCFMEPEQQKVSSSRLVDVLRRFCQDVKVNFIADNEEYALMGWKLHINDYLMRPLTTESIQHAKRRAEGL